VLVGRDAEQARIRDLLQAARLGRSGVLVLRGEAGIGKTALLEYACSQAEAMTVAQAAGVESESTLPFAGLASLAGPLLAYLPALLPRQRAALEAALALGPPVESDRLAVAAATLALLAAAAEDRPLLVLVDDAHWMDKPSREAVLFAARRLGDEGICMLVASRDGEPDSLDPERIAQLTVPPLRRSDALELVTTRAQVALSVAEEVCTATAGNPLALLAVPALLTEDQRAGRSPLTQPVHAGSAEAAFGRLTAGLSLESRRALLVAGADGSGLLEPVLRTLDGIGIGRDALAPAEQAGLITIDGNRLLFRHPLVRSAVYHAADPAQRRSVHAALAEAYDEESGADRRAWHLAAAVTGPDEQVAAALEAAAGRASQRHGYAAAVHALARAAELSPHSGDAVRRLLAAARAAELAGQPDRVLALTEAAGTGSDPVLDADLALLRARAIRDRDPAAAATTAEQTAVAIAAHDAARESALLLEAAMAAERFASGRAAALAARAADAARRAGVDPSLADLAHARLLHLAGQPVEQSTAVVLNTLADLDQARIALWIVGANPIPDHTQDALTRAIISMARERAALRLLPEALSVHAINQFYLGDWDTAVARSHEAIGLGYAVDRPSIACEAHGTLVRIHAFQGDEQACREHLAEYLRLSRALGMAEYEDFAGVYLGELALTRGQTEEAIRHLEPTAAVRSISRARAGLVEAYVRSGRLDLARASLADLDRLVARTGSASGRVFAPRLHGMLADDPAEASAAFDEALRAADTLGWPLETARTELLCGERLRRDRRRREARPHLVRAAEIFDRLGARPWAERAKAERSASGERARRGAHQAIQLTPQELELARTVAAGATNREAAERMFVSPKTIEAHLGAIYRKLGLRSRTELAAWLQRRA